MILPIVVIVNFPGSTGFGVGAVGNMAGQKKGWVGNKILFKTWANRPGECVKSATTESTTKTLLK